MPAGLSVAREQEDRTFDMVLMTPAFLIFAVGVRRFRILFSGAYPMPGPSDGDVRAQFRRTRSLSLGAGRPALPAPARLNQRTRRTIGRNGAVRKVTIDADLRSAPSSAVGPPEDGRLRRNRLKNPEQVRKSQIFRYSKPTFR